MDRFAPLEGHFNRYLMIGGFPELVLSDYPVQYPKSAFNGKTIPISLYELHRDVQRNYGGEGVGKHIGQHN